MNKFLLGTVMFFAASQSNAFAEKLLLSPSVIQQAAMASMAEGPIHWHVGDRAMYNISSSLISGTSEQYVREDAPDGMWMHVDVKMGYLGTQVMEMLFDKSNGQIKKLLVNGKEQSPPDTTQLDLVDTHNEHISVAAGEFDTVYAKRQNRSDSKIQEAWTDDKDVPMGGMVRAIGDSQIGKVTQELQSFSFAQ